MGAPIGNQNARKAKLWEGSLKRALARLSEGNTVESGLDRCAERLISAALEGERWALEQLGDRIDGKPAQTTVLAGDEDNPVSIKGVIDLVRPG